MKRLVASFLILLVTALGFRFGHSGTVMHIASMTAGLLLAISVIVDRWYGETASPVDASRRHDPPAADPPAPQQG